MSYILSYAILYLVGVGLLSWYEITQKEQGVVETCLAIVTGSSQIGAGIAMAIASIEGVIMVIASYFIAKWKERGRAEGEEQGRVEGEEQGRVEGEKRGRAEGEKRGREEIQEMWESWNQRRLEAEGRGEPFDEPPPTLNSNGRNRNSG